MTISIYCVYVGFDYTYIDIINALAQGIKILSGLKGLVSGRCWDSNLELGNGIYVSISMNGSDTPVTRPETDKAGLSSRDRWDSNLWNRLCIYVYMSVCLSVCLSICLPIYLPIAIL